MAKWSYTRLKQDQVLQTYKSQGVPAHRLSRNGSAHPM